MYKISTTDTNRTLEKQVSIHQDWSRDLSELGVIGNVNHAFTTKIKGRLRLCLVKDDAVIVV